jgi:alkane 1-monooxygenase
MAALPFLLPLIFPLTLIVACTTGRSELLKLLSAYWFVILILDLIIRPAPSIAEDYRNGREPASAIAAWILRIWVPIQMVLLFCALLAISEKDVSAYYSGLLSVYVGFVNGICCAPVAHELMHRRRLIDKRLAELLMLLFTYPHFCIEHILGHHRRVGTTLDPGTARLGESFYSFYIRAISGGLISAFIIELGRVNRYTENRVINNRFWYYWSLVIAIYLCMAVFFGLSGIAFFMAQSIIAFSTIEVINYIEHYGLRRRKQPNGAYEPVSWAHSWDSTHRVSNWFLFNLGKHAHHHVKPSCGFLTLRGSARAPQLPTGYFGMFWLAFFPPLWRRVMDRRISTYAGASSRLL